MRPRCRWCAKRYGRPLGGRHTGRVLHGARTLGRFRGALLRRSPPRSSTRGLPPWAGIHEVLTTRARTRLSKCRGGCVRMTLLTLTPAFPSRPDPCDSAIKPNLLSWGFPKTAPPSYQAGESAVRVPIRYTFPRSFPRPVGRAAAPPAIRSRGFSPPQRLAPLRPCRSVSPCCRSWGSLRFTSSRDEDPRSAILPFEAFPPLKAFAVTRGHDVPSILPPRDNAATRPSLQALDVTVPLALPAFLPMT